MIWLILWFLIGALHAAYCIVTKAHEEWDDPWWGLSFTLVLGPLGVLLRVIAYCLEDR
jgi:hypothetical protein